MVPRIQYVKASDGVSIAYSQAGDGPAYVALNDIPFSHIQLEEQYGVGFQPLHEAIGGRFVRLDPRGMGMSDREVDRITIDAWVSDLEAVVDRLELDQFVLGGSGFSGVIAISYATRHPERVSRLTLLNAPARPADAFAAPASQSLAEMLVRDWEMFSENVGALAFGWGRDQARVFGEYVRACSTQELARRTYAALVSMDVTELLPSLTMPVLVISHDGVKYAPLDLSRHLVSDIPDARLVVMEGVMDPEPDFKQVAEFVMEGREQEPEVEHVEPGAFRTIFFTDIEGSTELTERLGDAKARDFLREHERITRDALAKHGGAEIKTMGDGFMASFSSATKALECGIGLQRAFAQYNESAPQPIKVRVGLNAGEPIAEDDPEGRGDLFGSAVNLAARICSRAEGGEILASEGVRQIVAGKGFLFSDLGESEMRGFEDPVRVYAVRWQAS